MSEGNQVGLDATHDVNGVNNSRNLAGLKQCGFTRRIWVESRTPVFDLALAPQSGNTQQRTDHGATQRMAGGQRLEMST